MGLFDNLFLDQNTPVLINDGVDHSKDVVTEIIPPSSTGSTSGGKGDDGSSSTDPQDSKPKKEEGFEELFEEDKPKEVIDAPAPVIEFKLSSETLGAPVSNDSTLSSKPEDSGVSFDIGGDMNFDIGGDMNQSSEASSPVSAVGSFIQSSVSIDSLGSSVSESNSMLNQATETSSISADPVTSVEVSPEITPSFADTQNIGNNNETDSALFSLLNDNTIPTESNITKSPITEDAFIPTPALEVTSPAADILATPEISVISEDSKNDDINTFTSSIVPNISPIVIDSNIHSDLDSPSNSKLKSKLEEFIDELKTLEIEDQEVKMKKRQQFEMFRVRAQEIKAEYDMRIRALELEEKALENQIAAMDNEKTQIKDVIRAFKLELEKA